jgi:hypothetical protein
VIGRQQKLIQVAPDRHEMVEEPRVREGARLDGTAHFLLSPLVLNS